jgi:hypothetical protein
MATRTVPRLERREEPPRSTPTWLGNKTRAIVEVVSAIAAVVTIVFAVRDALQEPKIHAQTAQSSTPFALYFSFHNPSLIFSMHEVQIECHIEDVFGANFTRYTGFNVTANEAMISIPPGKTRQYNCPFEKVLSPLPSIERADIRLIVQFKTVGFNRHITSEMFSWSDAAKQWVEGEIIK